MKLKQYEVVLFFALGLFLGLSTICQANDSDPNKPISSPPADPINNELNLLLDNIQKHCQELKNFQANMTLEQIEVFTDDVVLQTGQLYYQTTKELVQFRIHFDSRKQWTLDEEPPAKPQKNDEDIAFNGTWLSHRNARNKTLIRWEISKETMNKEAFRLGQSQIPLPFAITKKDLLKHFEVSLGKETEKSSEKKSLNYHLKMIPKKEGSFADEYVQFELWVSKEKYLPTQCRYENHEGQITTSSWTNINNEKKINASKFKLKPTGADWTIKEHTLSENAPKK